MLRNRVLLKWKEPQFARKAAVKKLTAKDYLIDYTKFIWKWIVGTFIFFSFIRWISPREVDSYFDMEILSIILFVTVCITLVWLIYAAAIFQTAEISLREKDIMYMSVSGTVILPYKKIQSCGVGKTNFMEQEFNFLEIKNWDDSTAFIEVDPKIEIGKVSEILKSKNIQVKSSLLNPI